MTPGQNPTAVVMATYNGARYLHEQLDSIAAQSVPYVLLARDDASQDDTVAILRTHPAKARLTQHATNQGFLIGFAAGIADALSQGTQWIALSDQDDVWDSDRLERGLAVGTDEQSRHGPSHPVLVHSDLRLIDSQGAPLGDSYFQRRGYRVQDTADLAGMLGQCGVMGNTVLMNRALAELCLPFPDHLHMHDWWLAVLAELFGTRRLLPRPSVSYRLHAHNTSNAQGQPMLLDWPTRLARASANLLRRDMRLPYLEDERYRVVQWLLDEPQDLPPLRANQRAVLEAFVAYAHLRSPRWQHWSQLRTLGMLPTAPLTRARTALALLTTQRYSHRA